jgi:hypothetical protein
LKWISFEFRPEEGQFTTCFSVGLRVHPSDAFAGGNVSPINFTGVRVGREQVFSEKLFRRIFVLNGIALDIWGTSYDSDAIVVAQMVFVVKNDLGVGW